MIQMHNCSVKQHHARILSNISCQLHTGELVAIIGPNGAGKSTLLKVLSGLITPSTGFVTLHQKALTQYSPKERAKQLAYLGQHNDLAYPLTVQELVALGRYPYGKEPHSTYQHAIDAALHQVGIKSLAHRYYHNLSGGEQQKAHLARVLTQMYDSSTQLARFLLLDEHTAHLDFAQQHHSFQCLKTSISPNIGAAVVTHDLNLALRYADRILLLSEGRLINTGTPHAVLTPEIIEPIFHCAVHRLQYGHDMWITPATRSREL